MAEEVPKQPEENQKKIPDESEIDALKASLGECQDKYLRVLAESENTRKRMQKERQELVKHSIEGVLVEFLHPIDCLEKALQFAETMSTDVKNWAVGFEMILNQFKQILANHGIEEYHSVGKKFDPYLHEGVDVLETDEYEPGIVVEEYVRGYKICDRPIRVARVKVSKKPEEKNPSPAQGEK